MTRPFANVIGVAVLTSMVCALLGWAALLVPAMLLRPLLPGVRARRACSHYMIAVATRWVATNRRICRLLHGRGPNVTLDARIDARQSYLVIANHRSWADILVLLDALHGHAEFPRFFLKRELLWLPVVGLACWGLEMPFMRRRARRAPRGSALRLRDMDTTRRFCERFRNEPVTVVNFVEGTRCTETKRRANHSPYRHLLRPKAAGLAFTLSAMGEQFAGLIDMTLIYRPVAPGRSLMWSYLCGEQLDLQVDAQLLPIPPDFSGASYETDPVFRERFQQWLNRLWRAKDEQIALAETAAGLRPHFNSVGANR